MTINKLEKAFELFDAYNRLDPTVISYEGVAYPAEYFFALRLHYWVMQLNPDAGEALKLASRCQHIGRWESPRDSYPPGKAGYLKWRSDLKEFHAQKAENILLSVGYEYPVIEAVKNIVYKKDLKKNDDVQVMENALCLVFLQHQYTDFIMQYDDEKVTRILQKSWAKMSTPGRAIAGTLHFEGRAKLLLEKALA
ncbi:MAG TPA: DUF4202 domain-containing protein [Chitinophagaceae bacterium]|nr:DUF4202 domain-containing protein [Chitinophagaceae bacterium]